jgi:hypothetical protein
VSERNLVFETMGQPRRGTGALIVYLTEKDRGETVHLLRRLTRAERLKLADELPQPDNIKFMPTLYPLEPPVDGSWKPILIPETDDPGNEILASIVPRLVNGEQTFSAWFPHLAPTTYRVYLDDEAQGRWVTVFAGEVAELDWRE